MAPAPSFTGKRLGSYKNEDVLLKKGKFGLYIVCGSKKYSLKGVVRKKEDSIKLEDVLMQRIQSVDLKQVAARPLDSSLSIKKSQKEFNFIPVTLNNTLNKIL